LKGAVSLGVGALERAQDGSAVLDVVIKNERVGHRFPGGVMDAADTWLEVRVLDAQGKTLFESGQRHAESPDDDAHIFTSYVTGSDGRRLKSRETNTFKTGVYNHTIPPRESEVVRFEVGRSSSEATTIAVRVRYRTRTLELQKLACDEFKTARGQAFSRGGLKHVAKNLDPCKPQPIVDIANLAVDVKTFDPHALPFEALYAHGQGLARSLQEFAYEARKPLEAALAKANSAQERAMAEDALAHLAAREGNEALTFEWAAKAEEQIGKHPSLDRARAHVLNSRWKLVEAAKYLQSASAMAPRDDGLLAELAIALGSTNRPRDALAITTSGLLLQPRDWDLLRVQSLSLDDLTPNSTQLDAAREAFLAVRVPDDAPGLKAKCSKLVPNCANERNPVHTHKLHVVR
jgi:hypothetical protein